MKQLKNKKIIITLMCIVICAMIVGYAAFSTSLSITGTSTIASNWSVLFTKIEEVSKTSGAVILDPPVASGTKATFNVDLKGPGDKVVYNITLANEGTLDAIVESIDASETGSDAIYFRVTGIKKGDLINKKTTKIVTVEMGFDASVTSQPIDVSNNLTLNITCVQNVGQNIPSEDIDITGPTVTSVSGNNGLVLNNSAGRALTNYKIYGNSIQNGTPVPTAPVAINSLGENNDIQIVSKSLNLFDSKNVSMSNGTYLNGVWTLKEGVYDRIVSKSSFVPKTDTDYTIVVDVVENTLSSQMKLISDNRFYFQNYNYIFGLNKTGRNVINAHTQTNFDNVTLGSLWFQSTNTVTGTFKCKIMIIEGELTEANIPEPQDYKNDVVAIDMSKHAPLRKVGDVADYIDFENRRIVRNIYKHEFTGTESWSIWTSQSTTKTAGVYWTDPTILGVYNNPTFMGYKGISTHFVLGETAHVADDTLRMGVINGSSPPYISFRIPYLTVNEWTNFLKSEKSKGNPLTIYIILKEPIYEKIDLPSIKTTMGQNTITVSDSNMNTSKIEASYYKK